MLLFSRILRMFLWMTFLTGVIYPLVLALIGVVMIPFQTSGSLLVKDNIPFGSTLIGQKFVSERYFWGRPSAIDYDPLHSGGSNLGPTSAALKDIVEKRKQTVAHVHGVDVNAVPAELIYASGSGLDPHISPYCAEFQIERVMRARGLQGNEHREVIKSLIAQFSQGYIFGQHCVNVLQLNAALDASGKIPTGRL